MVKIYTGEHFLGHWLEQNWLCAIACRDTTNTQGGHKNDFTHGSTISNTAVSWRSKLEQEKKRSKFL